MENEDPTIQSDNTESIFHIGTAINASKNQSAKKTKKTNNKEEKEKTKRKKSKIRNTRKKMKGAGGTFSSTIKSNKHQ